MAFISQSAVIRLIASRKVVMASGGGDARSFRVESYVRGYRVYQRIWNPFVGEVALHPCSWFSSLQPLNPWVVRSPVRSAHCHHRHRSLLQPFEVSRLGFFLGGSAEGVQRIGSGSSSRSKNFVILPAPAIATFFSRSFTPVPTKA